MLSVTVMLLMKSMVSLFVITLITLERETKPDDFVQYITNAIQRAGSKMSSISTLQKKVCDQPEWFDSECIQLKGIKYNNLRRFRNSGTMVDLRVYKQSKCVFKKLRKHKKMVYQRSLQEKVVNTHSRYFKLLEIFEIPPK